MSFRALMKVLALDERDTFSSKMERKEERDKAKDCIFAKIHLFTFVLRLSSSLHEISPLLLLLFHLVQGEESLDRTKSLGFG